MGFSDRLKEARLAKGLSQKELAMMVKVSSGAISNYENGVSSPNEKIMYALFDALGVDPNFLFQDEYSVAKAAPAISSARNHPDILHFSGTKEVRILGNIACGSPMLAVEEDEYVEVPAGVPYENAVRCKGDSMDGARILDGDIVFIDFDAEVRNGDIAAVRIGDNVTLKKVYAGDNYVRLLAANPNFQEQYYHDGELDQIEIIGRAMSFWSKVR